LPCNGDKEGLSPGQRTSLCEYVSLQFDASLDAMDPAQLVIFYIKGGLPYFALNGENWR
jgi:hypothetical protein